MLTHLQIYVKSLSNERSLDRLINFTEMSNVSLQVLYLLSDSYTLHHTP